MRKIAKKSVKKAATVGKKTPLRKHLEAMNETALIDLILEFAKKHDAIHSELENRFSTTDQRIVKLETATVTSFSLQSSYYCCPTPPCRLY